MARKRASASTTATDTLSGAAIAAAFREGAATAFKGAGPIEDTFFHHTYGISLAGNLPLQFLFGIDVLPLGMTIGLLGDEGSMKSTLGWHLCSYFVLNPVAHYRAEA